MVNLTDHPVRSLIPQHNCAADTRRKRNRSPITEELSDECTSISEIECAARSRKKRRSIETDRDYISELPDDILSSIVSYFNVRDTARASLVSRRWRNLCASKSNLQFCLNTMLLQDTDWSNMYWKVTCRSYKVMFVKVVNQYLQGFKGSQLEFFRISFCLDKDSLVDIDKWIRFAASMSVKHLHLEFSCGHCHTCGKRSQSGNLYTLWFGRISQRQMSKMQTLFIGSCIIGPGVFNQYSNLISLTIRDVVLGKREIDLIVCYCFNLETMTLNECTLSPILCIPSSFHRLNFLAITRCCKVEKIELCATNLVRFEYDGDDIQISSRGAPNLKSFFFKALDEERLQYLYSRLAKDLPLVETLSVFSTANWVQCIPERITTFSKMKQLELFSPVNVEFDIPKIASILTACPYLEKFHLGIHSGSLMPAGFMPVVGSHECLKEIHICGFRCTGNFIDFVIYLLKFAAALESMVIDPKLKLYCGIEGWATYPRKTWDGDERATVCSLLRNEPRRSLIHIK